LRACCPGEEESERVLKENLEVQTSSSISTNTVPFYRLERGDHFYTTSADEMAKALAAGYKFEEIAAYVYATENGETVAFYRLVNPRAGQNDHLYTTSVAEVNEAIATGGYKFEGIAAYIYATENSGTVAFYRLVSSSHFYTTSEAEKQKALADGYQSEGIAGYVYQNQSVPA
jgi:predicted HAD superfamily Cof-like phosphohydrolase